MKRLFGLLDDKQNFFTSLAFSSTIAKFLEVMVTLAEKVLLWREGVIGRRGGSENPDIPFLALTQKNAKQAEELS